MSNDVLGRLNQAQREAAEAVRGPVAILAGAGTGKTTTITHRIAHQVASAAFPAEAILAVTFTEKAARELKSRLGGLGVEGVEARTFHSAALSQLSRLWTAATGEALPEILDAKGPVIASLANALPMPYKFVPRRDLASEVEWAKNRMIPPGRYLDSLGDRQPPVPPDLMLRVYDGYERRKRSMGRMDFEDMLGLALRLFDEQTEAAGWVRDRYRAFTVDEYQDVNPLQQALLERWLGGRDELCVVGDDYQTIYGFTGASPRYLLEFTERYPEATVVRLEENYRSSPEVLQVANRVAVSFGGFEKILRATRDHGPDPLIHSVADERAEVSFVLHAVRRLHASGTPLEEMAILVRINARTEPYEEAFAEAGIPYQVRDGAFLRRPGPRATIARLRRASGDVAEAVAAATAALGYAPDAEPDSSEEVTRQADLGRLRALAVEFAAANPGGDLEAFLAELRRRFSTETEGRGVQLLTYHRAKGLEFDVVLLPRLLDGEIPFRSGRSKAPVDEERRLLYVGVTRARTHLAMTWPLGTRAGRTPFLDGLVAEPATEGSRARARRVEPVAGAGGTFEALKRWRLERSKADGVPAYVVFHDATLASIAELRPASHAELRSVPGIGPAKLERYGDEVLAVVAAGVSPG